MSRIQDRRKSIILASLLVLPSVIFVNSSPLARAEDRPEIDAATKRQVVDRLAELMRDLYVFPEVGTAMAEHIVGRHRGGAYDDYRDLVEFCRQVTSDLREVSDDKHLFLFYSPEEAREVAARKGLLPEDEIKQIEEANLEASRRDNFGFRRVEILDGNIGYLKLDLFYGQDRACDIAAAAMEFLSCADAIIIDLRDNGGGGGGVGALLSSYFFEGQSVQLTGGFVRETGAVRQSWTLPYVPGRRLPDVDLYILTSGRTFSAAEDFAYSLKHLDRATIVGETTKGGAHPVDVLTVKGDILTQISIGNSVNPITGSNWEGVGVAPDIRVPAAKALEVAHLAALKKLLARTTDDKVRQSLTLLISKME